MSSKFELLPSQKDEVFLLLRKANADCIKFSWKQFHSRLNRYAIVTALVRNDTNFYFVFQNDGYSFQAIYSPGNENVEDYVDGLSWPGMKNHFETWLHYLYREIKTPNFWEQLAELISSQETELPPQNWENSFNKKEKINLNEALANIEEYIKKVAKTTEEQNKIVLERLDYLAKALERLNRRDWTNSAFSTILQVASHLALNPEHVKAILSFITQAVDNVKLYLPFLGS